GSGKSTLLQIVCGTLGLSEGTVSVNGRISALLELGTGFNPEFTGRENVLVAGSVLGLERREIEQKYDGIVAFADIGEFIDQPVKTYSSGMYVRLAFSVAIAVEPEILVVDEALAVGDIFFQQKCARHMRENLAEATKLLVTHDMHAVTTLADRVLVLDRGQAVFTGSPLEAVEYYTKLMHNDAFGTGAAPTPESAAAPTALRKLGGTLPWIAVPEESRGGARAIQIERVAVTRADHQKLTTVRAAERVVVHMTLRAARPSREILFGYIVNDRLGNAIFGENTVSMANGIVDLAVAGVYIVRFEFDWPEIQPGEYTITLGVGEGNDALSHVIQCWAHNAVAVSAISPDKVVHCLFNNPILDLEVAAVE
ncbi:MAG: Wzt carbohydrate-binding domain-containing protein, partial [Planctomycetes bacterium]|nr:Wzt carbohydrate-binding domain-containing protein [Planctomycetota bacterium]